jgi:hypothetical protein
MTEEKDRVIEGKKERQKTMDKLSVKSGQAYTYDTEKGEGSGCGSEPGDKKERKRDR